MWRCYHTSGFGTVTEPWVRKPCGVGWMEFRPCHILARFGVSAWTEPHFPHSRKVIQEDVLIHALACSKFLIYIQLIQDPLHTPSEVLSLLCRWGHCGSEKGICLHGVGRIESQACACDHHSWKGFLFSHVTCEGRGYYWLLGAEWLFSVSVSFPRESGHFLRG